MRDDFDPVVAARFTVLDELPVPDTWSRVQFKALDPTPSRSIDDDDATMIGVSTPIATGETRRGPQRVVVAVLLAAATVAAIALVAIRKDHPASPADQPSPTVNVPPTAPPRALFGTPAEEFVPGTYFVDQVEGAATPRIFVTLGEGWRNTIDAWAIRNDAVGVMAFSRPDRVFVDACHSLDGFHPGPVTTLDGLVAALSEQRGWADMTAPSDITVNGYHGKTFQRTAPASFEGCDISFASFRSWENGPEGGTNLELGWSYYEPDEIETLDVLDVNGTIIIINTRLKPGHQDPVAAAGLEAVLDSIRIQQT
jgi:hypothetical protein